MSRVSVILPSYKSHGTIAACLRALRLQSFRDFEVFVVDSSPEGLGPAIVADFPEVRFLQSEDRLLPHAARNLGVEASTGDLLVFSDPDCIADPKWLEHLVAGWESGREILGGAMGLVNQNRRERGIHLCKFHPYLTGQRSGPRWILPTANVAYTRNLWNRLGPFEGDLFAGDAIQSWRAASAGFEPWLDPRAIVSHHHDQTPSEFLSQRFHRGIEFVGARAGYEKWSRDQVLLRGAALPLLVLIVLLRAARDAWRSGWFADFLATIPLQIAGHAAWSAGESLSCWRLLTDSSAHRLPLSFERDRTPQ